MAEDRYKEALQKALKRLETSDRYESEVRQTLRRYSPEVVDQVIRFLAERRLLDDGRTTAEAVSRNTGRRAVGDELLRDRLVRRGADETLLGNALESAPSESDRILEILKTRYRPSDPPAKAGRYLVARGFDEEAIRSAVESYFEFSELDAFSEGA